MVASEVVPELGDGLQGQEDGLGAVLGGVGTGLVVAQVALFVVVVTVLAVALEAVASEYLVPHLMEVAQVKGEEVVVSEVWAPQVHQIWLFL